jgi:hypothetical protein
MKMISSRDSVQGNLYRKDWLLEKFITKYETIFKWMLIGYNKKGAFWENIRRHGARGVLD